MRFLIILILSTLSLNLVKAQSNLVLNGGFEETIVCPANMYHINNGLLVNVTNPGNYSPDYYNICYNLLPSGGFGVPSNARGFQFARTGDAYIGIDLWEKNNPAREYVQIKFSDSLKQGHHYLFSCYLNMANNFRYATANFGAYFSLDSVSMAAVDVLPFVPQLENVDTNILTDTLNWVEFTGTFLASGEEKFVLLGNFKPVAEGFDTAYQYYGSPNHSNWAYYYIDDVSLIDLDSSLAIIEHDAFANRLSIFPNPSSKIITLSECNLNDGINIYDITGKQLYQAFLNESKQINIEHLEAGIYILKVQSNKGLQVGRIVKE